MAPLYHDVATSSRTRRARPSAHGDWAVIVAVSAVGVMEVAIDEVVRVIAVGDRIVPAARPVHVRGIVCLAVVIRGARRWVFGADREGVVVDVISVSVMQMAVVQEVLVTVVLDGLVTAVRAVRVVVIRVLLVLTHACLSFGWSRLAWYGRGAGSVQVPSSSTTSGFSCV